jgi:Asp-tRNA(Asn)/Glu-tRNA(Gln) amidotransferase A subunit family amidase
MQLDPYAGVVETARALATGEVSARALLEATLARIASLNPRLHALRTVLTESAWREAERVDRRRTAGLPAGALAGLPVAVKEIIDTVPAACSAGLPFLADYRPERDAVVVRRLRRAGAHVVGQSVTDPGAFGVRTAEVTHPQAPERTVGGSSGGSAAALAAGLALAALGSDTGGSIRIPSACCATAGLKPTRGCVPLEGVRPLVWSLDHVGPMTRRVADLAAVQKVLDPGFARMASAPPERVVIGHDPRYAADADPEVAAGLEAARAACRRLGWQLREVVLPPPDDALAVHAVIFCSEAAAYHFAAFPEHRNDYPETARRLLGLAETQTGFQYVQAMRRRADMTAAVDLLFREVDAVLVPTLPVLAPARDVPEVEIAGRARDFTLALVRYTCLFDHTGHPVVAMPASVVGPGVATSVQVVGARGRDAALLTLAARLETALGLDVDYRVRV